MNEKYIGGENIESGTGRLLNIQTVQEAVIIGPSFKFKVGHVVYSKVRPNLQKFFLADFEGVCSSDIYPLKVNTELVVPKYFALVLQSKLFAKKTGNFQEGRSGMPKINQDQLAHIKILRQPIKTQRQIVEKLDKQMQALEGVRFLKSEAEQRIEEILAGVWGE